MNIQNVVYGVNLNRPWLQRTSPSTLEFLDWLISEHDRLTENDKLWRRQNEDNAQENGELREANHLQWEEIQRLTAELASVREERDRQALWTKEVEKAWLQRKVTSLADSGMSIEQATLLAKNQMDCAKSQVMSLPLTEKGGME